MIVPEPEAKARLRARGVAVPRSVVLDADGLGDGVDELHAIALPSWGESQMQSIAVRR